MGNSKGGFESPIKCYKKPLTPGAFLERKGKQVCTKRHENARYPKAEEKGKRKIFRRQKTTSTLLNKKNKKLRGELE